MNREKATERSARRITNKHSKKQPKEETVSRITQNKRHTGREKIREKIRRTPRMRHEAISYNTVSGSESFWIAPRFANVIDPKLEICPASISGYRFRAGPHPEKGAQFRIKPYSKKTSGIGFRYVIGGNMRETSRKQQ